MQINDVARTTTKCKCTTYIYIYIVCTDIYCQAYMLILMPSGDKHTLLCLSSMHRSFATFARCQNYQRNRVRCGVLNDPDNEHRPQVRDKHSACPRTRLGFSASNCQGTSVWPPPLTKKEERNQSRILSTKSKHVSLVLWVSCPFAEALTPRAKLRPAVWMQKRDLLTRTSKRLEPSFLRITGCM